jgi:hypothetical protein
MRSAATAAGLLSLLMIAGCANGDQAIADKVAAAEAAASRAEAAQHAAEKAAANAASAHPAPTPEPTVMADTPAEINDGDNGDDEVPTGGSAPTIGSESTAVSGQGA